MEGDRVSTAFWAGCIQVALGSSLSLTGGGEISPLGAEERCYGVYLGGA